MSRTPPEVTAALRYLMDHPKPAFGDAEMVRSSEVLASYRPITCCDCMGVAGGCEECDRTGKVWVKRTTAAARTDQRRPKTSRTD